MLRSSKVKHRFPAVQSSIELLGYAAHSSILLLWMLAWQCKHAAAAFIAGGRVSVGGQVFRESCEVHVRSIVP